jgi:branched-chain amino acid transport system substrate-binding protein
VGHRRGPREDNALRRNKLPLVIAILALVLPACGTRLPNSAFVKAQQGSNADTQALAGDPGTTSDQSGSTGPAAGQTPSSGGSTPAGGPSGGNGSGTAQGPAGGNNATGAGGPNTASDVGVTPTSIKIGNITSIGGSFGPDAFSPSLYGLESFISAVNARGGVNGRKIDFHTCDDNDTGDQNLSCAQQLVEQQKVFGFIGNNSESSARSAAYTAGKGVPDLGLPLNNGYYKYPTMFSFYGGGGAIRDGKQVGAQGKNWQPTGQYRWMKQQRGIDKGAVFFYSIAVSQQQGYAIEANMAAEGINLAYEGGGSKSGENFAAPTFDTDVVNMQQKGVNGVWDAMDVAGNQKLCAAMDRRGFTVKAKISTIEVWGQKVGSDFSSPCRNSVYSQGVSDPYSDKGNALVSQFLGDFSKYQPGRKLHQWSLEGWAMGYEFAKAAATMGPNLTRAGWMKWLNNLNQYTLDGLVAPFDYKQYNYNAPYHDCFSVVQWSDPDQTFKTVTPISTCYEAKWIGYTPSDDGS